MLKTAKLNNQFIDSLTLFFWLSGNYCLLVNLYVKIGLQHFTFNIISASVDSTTNLVLLKQLYMNFKL